MTEISLSDKIRNRLKTKGVKDYLFVFRASFINQIVGVLRGFVVAKFLGPADYGLMSGLKLINMLDKFGQFGLTSVVLRDVPYLKGQGDHTEEAVRKVKETAYTTEIWLGLLLCLLGVGSSFFTDDLKTSVGIIICSVALGLSRLQTILMKEAMVHQHFEKFSRVILWTGLLASLLIMCGVPWGEVWWVLAVPIIQHIVAVIWLKQSHHFHFVRRIDWTELKRQLTIGIPMTLQALAYGSFRYAERLTVLWYFTIYELGLVSIGTTIMSNIMNVLGTGARVRKIAINELLGKKDYHGVHVRVVRETLLHVGAAVGIAVIAWPLLDIVVPLVLPKYIEAIFLIQLLLLAPITRNLAPYCQIILHSTLVNKQAILGPTQFACTLLLVGSAEALQQMGLLELDILVGLNVLFYTVFALAEIIYYYIYYYRPYVQAPKA